MVAMRAELSGQSLLKTTAKSALAALLVSAAALAAETPMAPRFAGPFDAGLMVEPVNHEASGLAPSRRADGLFWVNADSGDEPVLYAIGSDGACRGKLRLAGVKNNDWEDLASFDLDGKSWLLVADCGDNDAIRQSYALHLVEEPDPALLSPGADLTLWPAWSVHFIYEDGARDCEAVAVDAAERVVYLLSKRDVPARLYRLPLAPADAKMPAAARFLGTVPGLPQPNSLQRTITAPLFAYRGQPCALDFSPDASLALVLTYGETLLFPRAPGETWAAALARTPVQLGGHQLPQAEAACFARDGRTIMVCSEKTMRWLRYERRER